jgi:hypothetical protein
MLDCSLFMFSFFFFFFLCLCSLFFPFFFLDQKNKNVLTAIRFLHPIQPPRLSESLLGRNQNFHSPSTMPRSKSGPRNRMAVRKRLRSISNRPTGHQPRSLRPAPREELSSSTMIQRTRTELTIHEPVTARMRARITDGASRLRLGDGRVVEER